MISYKDRTGDAPEQGAAIQVRGSQGVVHLALGVMRNFNSLSEDAWASLTPQEARELARDLFAAADQQETRKR